MRMISLPQAGPRGGREVMKCEAKEKEKKIVFYFTLLPHMTGSRTCCVYVHLP